jgi:hypothetical protein
MGLHQVKNLCTAKKTIVRIKRACRVGESLCQYSSDRRLINRKYKELRNIKYQRTNNLINK